MFIKLGTNKVINSKRLIAVNFSEPDEFKMKKVSITFDYSTYSIPMGAYHEDDCNTFVYWLMEANKL